MGEVYCEEAPIKMGIQVWLKAARRNLENTEIKLQLDVRETVTLHTKQYLDVSSDTRVKRLEFPDIHRDSVSGKRPRAWVETVKEDDGWERNFGIASSTCDRLTDTRPNRGQNSTNLWKR